LPPPPTKERQVSFCSRGKKNAKKKTRPDPLLFRGAEAAAAGSFQEQTIAGGDADRNLCGELFDCAVRAEQSVGAQLSRLAARQAPRTKSICRGGRRTVLRLR